MKWTTKKQAYHVDGGLAYLALRKTLVRKGRKLLPLFPRCDIIGVLLPRIRNKLRKD